MTPNGPPLSLPMSSAPPSTPLPPLPVTKTRKILPETPVSLGSSRGSSASLLPTPTSSRSATPSSLPTSIVKSYTTSSLPTLKSVTSASPSPLNDRTIAAFPQPPRGTRRLSGFPSSQLSNALTPEDVTVQSSQNAFQPRGTAVWSQESVSSRPETRRVRSSGYGLKRKSSGSTLLWPTLANGAGAVGPVSYGTDAKDQKRIDSLLDSSSHPTSRTTSGKGSPIADIAEDYCEKQGPRRRVGSPDDDNTASQTTSNGKGNVLVSVRVRPENDSVEDAPELEGWKVDGHRSSISFYGRDASEHHYDNVFAPHDHNSRVYDSSAKHLVRRVMEGYHGTVFAYGSTGSGKTFSMQGTARSPGVIPLAITDIFSYIRENPGKEFLLRVSYMEIYNEKIHDLLSPTSGPQQDEIQLREDGKGGVYATPLKEEIVQSPNQLLRVIARGDQVRRTASTLFNARSSRSHAVVQIVIESRERVPMTSNMHKTDARRSEGIVPGGVLISTLSLIDLAGSEKAAENKERRTEGGHINKSLLTLGTVIARLSGDENDNGQTDGAANRARDHKHLPYRDSKLTRLLQPALSGNSLVSILCTVQLSSAGTSIAAASLHTAESLNTLKFASRAKNNIVSHARRNESHGADGIDAGSRALLERYILEIQDLRSQLDQQKQPPVQDEDVEDQWRERERERLRRHEEQLLEMRLARTALKERIGHLNRLILSSKSLGVNSSPGLRSSPDMGGASPDSLANGHAWSPGSDRPDRAAAIELPTNSGKSTPGSRSVSVYSTGPTTLSHPTPVEFGYGVEQDAAEQAGEGTAGADQRIHALQVDLADKNRYIASLEKRLLQARRSSRSKVDLALASRPVVADEDGQDRELREKDQEIERLRARLDDQIQTVAALKSAAFRRDARQKVADRHVSSEGSVPSSPWPLKSCPSDPATHRRTSSGPPTWGGKANFSRPALVAPTTPSQEAQVILPAARSPGAMIRLLDDLVQDKADERKWHVRRRKSFSRVDIKSVLPSSPPGGPEGREGVTS